MAPAASGGKTARYAVYFAPPAGSPLDRFGAAWLGRDARTGAAPAPPDIGLAPERWREITADARHYGFHATLKPPFALAEGTTEAALLAAVAGFAAARPAFAAPALRLAAISGFLALVPDGPAPALHALADDCVRAFDRFRAPPPAAELERRRRAGLSARQEALLAAWGYPYVMEEFRFHLTLTCRLPASERDRIADALAPLVEPLCREPLRVDGLAVFRQPSRTAPFAIVAEPRFGVG